MKKLKKIGITPTNEVLEEISDQLNPLIDSINKNTKNNNGDFTNGDKVPFLKFVHDISEGNLNPYLKEINEVLTDY